MSMATRTDTQSPALHVADSHDLICMQGAREQPDNLTQCTRCPSDEVAEVTAKIHDYGQSKPFVVRGS